MTKCKIGIINLNINNLFSIEKACLEAGYKVKIIDDKEKKYDYDILLLPGVGAFSSGIEFLKKNGIDEKIQNYLHKPKSFLYGICLGMQLLFDSSNEFKTNKGLKLIEGKVINFTKQNKEKIINIGWSKFNINDNYYKKNFSKFEKNYFYFIHSFYADPLDKKNILAKSLHGKINFCSITKKKNIFGTQFHPEKSGKSGIEFLKKIKELI